MITSITLDDANGNAVVLHDVAATSKRIVTHATGLLGGGVAPPRDSRRVRPQAHGGIDDTKYTDGKIVTLDCEAWSNVSVEDAEAEYRAMVAPMQQTLDVGPATLKWREGTAGLDLQREVKIMAEVDPPLQEAAAIIPFTAQFFSEDPRAYSQVLTLSVGLALSAGGGGLTFPFTFPFVFTASSGGAVTVTNYGEKPSPPIFRIYGYALNPQIVNLATQQRIVFAGEISTGNYLEVDVASRTVTLNGTTNQRNLLDSSNTTWFELQKGTTYLQLVAGTFDASARLDVLHRDAH